MIDGNELQRDGGMEPWTALISAGLQVSKEMLFEKKKKTEGGVGGTVFHGGREKHNSSECEKSQ